VVLVGALCLAAVAVVGVRACTPSQTGVLTVMTRNLYLGGDITRPIRAADGRTGPDALLALGHANRELRDIVDRTDFGIRSRLLAAEIGTARPDLLGLQEVALWRRGPLQLDRLGEANATEVDVDFLALLLAELAGRGLDYRPVRVQQESDVEAPAFTGDPSVGTASDAQDIRLTLRDVILVRAGSGVQVTGTGSGNYRARIEQVVGGLPVAFVRGFVWADVTVGSTRLRFVDTHLESASADVALAQASELLAGPVAETDRPVVLVADGNSDPDNTGPEPGSAATGAAAYELLTGTGRFADAWLASGEQSGPGYTATYGELLEDPTSAALDRRLDLILARGLDFDRVPAEVTGDDPSERDPATGLWPSDHAGVVARLQTG